MRIKNNLSIRDLKVYKLALLEDPFPIVWLFIKIECNEFFPFNLSILLDPFPTICYL